VAVNKIDKGNNPEEVEKELFDYGLNIEPHGGNVPVKRIIIIFLNFRSFISAQNIKRISIY